MPSAAVRMSAALAATCLVAACSGHAGMGPVAATGPAGPVAAAPAPATAAPAAPRREAARLRGVARYFGQPMADATVNVVAFGKSGTVASTRTGADGRFSLELPAGVARGAMLKVVASQGPRIVASVAAAPPRKLLQAEAEVELVLDEHQTTAYLVLARRLEATALVSTGADGEVAAGVVAEALAAFARAAEDVAKAGRPITPPDFDRADVVLDALGNISDLEKAAEPIRALVPADVAALIEVRADELAVLIRAEVAAGKTRPAGALVDALPIAAGKDAVPVFVAGGTATDRATPIEAPAPPAPAGGGGTGGGGTGGGGDAGGTEDAKVTAEGGLDVADGVVKDPPATPSMSLGE